MELMSVKDAIKLINTLSKYLDEEKIAEILKELDISIIYFDHNEITIPDSFSDKLLKIFFIDTLNMDIADILDEASNNSKILSCLDSSIISATSSSDILESSKMSSTRVML